MFQFYCCMYNFVESCLQTFVSHLIKPLVYPLFFAIADAIVHVYVLTCAKMADRR